MKTINAHIESNGQGMYSVYVEEDLPFGLLGEGLTIEEAKIDFLAVYEGMRAAHKARTGEDVSYEFRFITDLSAFLANYKYIMSLAGLSKLTGINKVQLSQYICGTRRPSPQTQDKIKKALAGLGQELIAASL